MKTFRHSYVFFLILCVTSCSLGGDEVAWASSYWQEDMANDKNPDQLITFAGTSLILYYHNNEGQIWLDAKHSNSKTVAIRRASINQKIKALPIIAAQEIILPLEIWQEVLLAEERYAVCKNLALLSLDNRKQTPQDYAACPGIKITSLQPYVNNKYIAFAIIEQSSYQLLEIIKITSRKILDLFADYDASEVSMNFAPVQKQHSILIFSNNGNLEWVGEGNNLNSVLFLLEKGLREQP